MSLELWVARLNWYLFLRMNLRSPNKKPFFRLQLQPRSPYKKIFSLLHQITPATMADNEEDLVDYDEEEEEENVAAEKAADAEGKEVKK